MVPVSKPISASRSATLSEYGTPAKTDGSYKLVMSVAKVRAKLSELWFENMVEGCAEERLSNESLMLCPRPGRGENMSEAELGVAGEVMLPRAGNEVPRARGDPGVPGVSRPESKKSRDPIWSSRLRNWYGDRMPASGHWSTSQAARADEWWSSGTEVSGMTELSVKAY